MVRFISLKSTQIKAIDFSILKKKAIDWNHHWCDDGSFVRLFQTWVGAVVAGIAVSWVIFTPLVALARILVGGEGLSEATSGVNGPIFSIFFCWLVRGFLATFHLWLHTFVTSLKPSISFENRDHYEPLSLWQNL